MNFTPKTLCIGFSKQEFYILCFDQLFTDNCVDQKFINMYPNLIKEFIKVIISSNKSQTFEQILTQTLCEMYRFSPDNIMQANYVNWDNKMVYNFQSLVSN